MPCKHGFAFYEQCAFCCPPPRPISKWAQRHKSIQTKLLKEERRKKERARREAEKREYQRRLHNMALSASDYMSDCLGEYAVQENSGEDGIEKFSSGAWIPSWAQIEDCMREAVWARFGHKLDDKTREDLIRLWKKDWRGK